MPLEQATLKELISNAKNLTILFVEDDKPTREELIGFLGTFFPKIISAQSAEEAWDKYNSNKIDLIVTDITLPQMSGMELIGRIRQTNTSIPLLILSAHRESEYFLDSIKYNVDGYLLKPFDLEQFLSVISKVVYRLDMEQKILDYNKLLETRIEEKTYELETKYLYDPRINLPNAIMLRKDLAKKSQGYLILLDISHFSILNKEYGKVFANKVLVGVAKMLSKNIIANSKLFKVESDRFSIFLEADMEEEVQSYCNQIISFFDNNNIIVDDVEIHISFSMGVDKLRKDASETLINCEYALDKAKEFGSRHFEIYNEEDLDFVDKKESVKWLRLTRKLIIEDSIEPYYQAMQEIQTGKIIKYEVLARGVENGEVIDPNYFLQSADKLGLLTTITRAMIKKSFEYMQDKTVEFSINLTDKDLIDESLIMYLKTYLEAYAIDPSRVTFEILENITVIKNADMITQKLNKLREMGFKIAVDDFGVENSNLSRFLEMHLDFIKIDGIFIKDLKTNENNRAITKAIVSLANTLGIKTVAEYVKDEETYKIVKECGVDLAQGYYIGKPSPRLLEE
ncbi:EAL domain-containing protein [Sulfurimonas sp.]|uniref:EAL domain-containing protein n=1 Tax=Sulfurimonas sp. TaxID=2022749 RepID=UPI00262E412A|nr:EAL domain-containing protein [Sulfurimonas sp.]